MSVEVNFDGLIGPTHNYAGLSWGNRASLNHAKALANPRLAVQQGLGKMKALADLGLVQGLFPPVERPSLDVLRRVGFSGSDQRMIEEAAKVDRGLLAAVYSASSMWTANAATVSPSADTADGRVHFTPANLINKLHRSVEAPSTYHMLHAVFPSEDFFEVHRWLPEHPYFGDEGAANHTRFCTEYDQRGWEFFVYGQSADSDEKPKHFPARQTQAASLAVARKHQLDKAYCIYGQQNPEVIDRGVFHNDVISVGNKNVLLYHDHAFLRSEKLLQELKAKFSSNQFHFISVAESELSVEAAVESYLFNSQLVSLNENEMALILPKECEENAEVWTCLEGIRQADNPIKKLIVQDVRESMKNGGGPACLRLRVVLSRAELKAVHQPVLMTDSLFARLHQWSETCYRDRLAEKDLADPGLLTEVHRALDELTQILELGSFYSFQK